MSKSATVDRDKMALGVIAAVSLALSWGGRVRFEVVDGAFVLRVDGLPEDFSDRVAEALAQQFGVEVDLLDSL